MASIVERNGKYCVVYYCQDPKKGARKQKWETYKTRKEAKNRINELNRGIKNGETFIMTEKCSTVGELLEEFVETYGKPRWSLSTYEGNMSLIKNYILPTIGTKKLKDIDVRFIEKYYVELQKMKAVPNPAFGNKSLNEKVSRSTIRDIHKLLNSCFKQAVKYDYMVKNPCQNANVPKYKPMEREMWTVEEFMFASNNCDDPNLKLAIDITCTATLRIGEALGLTWDCVDISPEAMKSGMPSIYINKEYQRVSKEALVQLNKKDVLMVFPEDHKNCKTVRILKTPKTEKSVRKIYIPMTVAKQLCQYKATQEERKEILGSEYQDYNMVLASMYGLPLGSEYIRKRFNRLIRDLHLRKVVFHSLRHTSITYKLKLSGFDVKAVQGDAGHSTPEMIMKTYSHIIDEDRVENAKKMENAFYNGDDQTADTKARLEKLMSDPDTATLLLTLVEKMAV